MLPPSRADTLLFVHSACPCCRSAGWPAGRARFRARLAREPCAALPRSAGRSLHSVPTTRAAASLHLFSALFPPHPAPQAYFKMNNVLIDDRRIKVDFSQVN